MLSQDTPQVRLNISGKEHCSLQCSFFNAVAYYTLSFCRMSEFFQNTIVYIEVNFVLPQEIREINKQYRNKNKETDILSFPMFSEQEYRVRHRGQSIVLGELFVCEEIIQKDAQTDGVSIEREMAFVFSHGILHLLGYDHSEEMFALQDKVCETIE